MSSHTRGRRSHSRSRSRSRSRSVELPGSTKKISEKDYFLKNDEFRIWLKEEKDRHFNDLRSDKARSYFRKFVKAWNRGRLPMTYYEGVQAADNPSSTSTSYKWSFTSNLQVNAKDLRLAREGVNEATRGPMASASSGSTTRSFQGPLLPGHSGPSSDRQYVRELDAERLDRERRASRKRAREEDNEHIEDVIGPKAVGREGALEAKRARRENDRAFRERDAEDDVGDDVLMGGDSFKSRIAQRDAARQRREEKFQMQREEKATERRERITTLRVKDQATMDMFKALAKERFG